MVDTGSPIDEYKDLSENMRHYANMRFAQLTIFIALTGGLLVVIFGDKTPPPNFIILLNLIGIFITVLFWIMEERAADYWNTFRRRAVELENKLGYQQYTIRPKPRMWERLTATNASRAIYALIILFWIATLLSHLSFCF